MANRITEEMKIQINELYYRLGVKAQVARELGISPASVTRYLIPDYVPMASRQVVKCDVTPTVPIDFIDAIFDGADFATLTKLTPEEEKAMVELRKEIYV